VISVNMLGASLAVNEARLHPFREEPNDKYGAVIFSLASMEIIAEPEERSVKSSDAMSAPATRETDRLRTLGSQRLSAHADNHTSVVSRSSS
jgi:hypothetical protein